MLYESVLQDIGSFGRYQQLRFALLSIPAGFASTFSLSIIIFMSYIPVHRCRLPKILENNSSEESTLFIPPDLRKLLLAQNLSQEELLNITLPKEDIYGVESYSQCYMYDFGFPKELLLTNQARNNFNQSDLKKVTCPYGWEYGNEFGHTIVMEWNLVCDRDYARNLIMTLSGIAGLAGTMLFSYLQDKIGRKPTLMVAFTWFFVTTTLSAFLTDAISFTVAWTLQSMVGTPLYQIPYILALEFVGPDRRTFVNCSMNMLFALAQPVVALIAWLCSSYVWQILLTTLPFVPLYGLWFCIDESPRWLLTVGRVEEAKEILRKIARINGKILREEVLDSLVDNVSPSETTTNNGDDIEGSKKSLSSEKVRMPIVKINTINACCARIKRMSYVQLFCRCGLALKTLVITYMWSVSMIMMYGLGLNVENLSGDRYLIFGLLGLVEIPPTIANYFLLDRVGRIWPMALGTALSGVASIATAFSPHDQLWLVVVMYLITKAFITGSFLIVYQVGGEVYPTVVRASGVGFASLISGASASATPFLLYAAMATNYRMLPMIAFGIMAMAGGVLSFLLPETAHQPLSDTIEESEVILKANCATFARNLSCKGVHVVQRRRQIYK